MVNRNYGLMESLVELKDISVTFKMGGLRKRAYVHALSDVSLCLSNQEILAVVGESGCGKSTLGRVVLGLIRPTSGEVIYMGENVWRRKRKQSKRFQSIRQIVHQDSYAALNPVRTVYQTLSAPLIHYGIKRENLKEEVCNLLKFIGVMPPDYFLNKYPHHLSGGQRQRIVFARSIIPKPKFIVADEPVSMIDASLRLSILDLMMKLNEELGIAFLYITHDLATARYIARKGRVVVIYLGRIVERGKLDEVFQRPLHPYFQALLAAAPIPDPKLARKKKVLPLKSMELPSVENVPSGCSFHPRCLYAEEICTRERPILKEYASDHWVACYKVGRMPS